MNLLVLDIDGVLNAHEWNDEIKCGQIHKDKVERLNTILRETGAKILISSAWRYLVHRGEMNLMGLEWLFRSHGIIANRLVGITDPDPVDRETYTGENIWIHSNDRGAQITRWIKDSSEPVEAYVVIDDLDLGISQEGHPFIQTQSEEGLTVSQMVRAVELLTSGTSCTTTSPT